jgi:iron(III) transport system ATP-binding protein
MTVYENVAYGLKVRKFPKEEIDRKVKSYLEILGLSGLENRYPSQLSGGQQQRVALARSLAYEPKVLLLDEPLSNLDFRVRDRMRVELRNLLKELNITSLYVTHDQEEAFVIADRIMVMNEGKVVQTGTPEEIYERPANTFVANFVGRANMFKAKAEVSDERGVVKIENSDIVLCCRTDLDKFNSCYVIIRPNEIGIFDSRPDFDENVFEGEILERTYRGPVTDHVVSLGNMEIMVTTHKHCRSTSPIERKRVFLHIPPDAITVIPSD